MRIIFPYIVRVEKVVRTSYLYQDLNKDQQAYEFGISPEIHLHKIRQTDSVSYLV